MSQVNLFHCTVAELPLDIAQFETIAILKKLSVAHRALAELKGMVLSIPNQSILINTLSLQESKHSSEIENIVTTQDDIFKAELYNDHFINPAAKEVQQYSQALHYGFKEIQKDKIIRLTTLIGIQNCLEKNKAGLRVLPGTELKNNRGETIYTPPQHKDDIARLMDNLITFINDDSVMPETDPLIKMAIIHHQFETIHPFYDGNGRTGRILNILYLVQQGLLDIPVLYLSRYLIQHKQEYYHHLQNVRETNHWEPWILYMLDAITETSKSTLQLIKAIKQQMQEFKQIFRTELPKIYKQELLNHLFKYPYTKIEFIEKELDVSWQTAKRYLEEITKIGLLEKAKIGKYNYYINKPLFELFLT